MDKEKSNMIVPDVMLKCVINAYHEERGYLELGDASTICLAEAICRKLIEEVPFDAISKTIHRE